LSFDPARYRERFGSRLADFWGKAAAGFAGSLTLDSQLALGKG